ncbi:zinc-binding dehydrogenase [Streptomyces amakusaensis]|uniref:Zinc-binding dehydrogenase n=1 Tax=Streptomyces amakusaensis TaxID=67271 RepID=A0ABW0ANQ3_9ACTN
MRAIRLHSFGPAENLVLDEIENPVPGPGQVRIAVAVSGVHLLDTTLRQGLPGPYTEPISLPTVPGREVAGVVDALGEGADPGWLGKMVVAHLGMVPGGYAEFAVTETTRLHEVPARLDPAEAVAMIGTGRTTLGILGLAELREDDIAIIPAAAGGIGSLLVQYVKNIGATAIGLAGGAAKVAGVLANGADLAVDYQQPDWPEQVRDHLGERRATIVFDSVGGTAGRAAVDLLAKGGRHLVFGWTGEKDLHDGSPLAFTEEELNERGITSEIVLGPAMLEKAGGLRALEERALKEAATGRLRPVVQRFPLADAARAHRALETRGTVGKVVLIPRMP